MHALALALLLTTAPPATGRLLEAPDAAHLRVMTWNIGANSIFADPGPEFRERDDTRPERFLRVLRAIDPDVACLQEVFLPRTAADVAQLFDAALPLPDGAHWQVHGLPDVVIVSRHPLSMTGGQSQDWGGGRSRTHALARVQAARGDVLVLCAHLESRGGEQNMAARQAQSDAIVATLRELRTKGELPAHTPRVLLGDWNAYPTEPARHMDTLLTGAIADRARHGQHAAPDGDGTALCDAVPKRNAVEADTDTFDLAGTAPFPPGRLDRVLFSDSVLRADGAFVLHTPTLEATVLAAHGLQAGDTLLNVPARVPDHLPVVVDFVRGDATSTTCTQ